MPVLFLGGIVQTVFLSKDRMDVPRMHLVLRLAFGEIVSDLHKSYLAGHSIWPWSRHRLQSTAI